MNVPAAKIYFPEEDKKIILEEIGKCLSTGQLTLGQHGRSFEERFAEYTGTKYALSVNSGTSSIEIPLRIFGVEGREVIVPTNTFFATAAAVIHSGGKPRFVDCNPTTFSIDIDSLRSNITPETAGVIVVHIGGIVTPDMGEIQKICHEHGLFLLEDAAHAHGSSFEGRMAGTFGEAASFSFYPTKVMTSGEGGMVVTNDQKIHEEALIYRDQGKAGFLTNFHTRLGYNWRMSEPHAIIGSAQLKRLPEFIADRQRIASYYDEALLEVKGVEPLLMPTGCISNYYKYIALLEPGTDRARVKSLMREKYQVSLSGEVYEVPCHMQPIFDAYGNGQLPQAEDICARHICPPVFATMTLEQARHVVESLNSTLQEIRA